MNELDASSLLAIVSRLKKPADLLHAAQASTALASVCRAQSLWQQLLEEQFDLIVSAPPGTSPHQASAAAGASDCPSSAGEQEPSSNAAEEQYQTTTAAAAAGPSRQLDLQETFRALATRAPSSALRFAAVFTDGGCDGMREQDLTYWADHAFQPNHWNPHCSDGKSNINIIGLLHPQGVAGDELLSSHRSYLVERCAAAAAVLFSPPQAPHQTREQAASALGTWSTTGLERLFMDLYQDLWLHQQDSTWGRLLLSGVPQPRWPQEFEKMADTAEAIQSNARHHAYESVGHVSQQEIEAAAAAVAESGGGSSRRRPGPTSPAAAATAAVLQKGPVQAAVTAAASEVGGSSSSRQLPLQTQKQQAQQDQARQQRVMQRHMVDKQLLPWFSSPDLTQTTSVIEEIVVSRVGHFTCPVSAGAVLLGQHPTLSSSSSSGGCGSDGGGSSGSDAESAQTQAVLRVKHDPMVAALDTITSYEEVLQAVAAGLLPHPVQHTETESWQYCEFGPLSKEQRQQRQQQGLYMRPIVWFRFTTPQPAPPAPADAEAAAADAAAETLAAHEETAAAAVDPQPEAAAAAAAAAADNASDAMDVTDEMTEVTTEVTASITLDGSSDDEYMSTGGDEFTTVMELPPAGWTVGQPTAAAGTAVGAAGSVSDTSIGVASPSATPPPPAAAAAADADMMPDVEELQAAFANAGGGFGAEFAESYGELPTAAVPPAAAPAPPQQQQQQSSGQYACSSSSSSSKAPWQQRGVPGVSVLPSPASVHEVEHSNAAPHMLLRMPLLRGPRSGNVAVVKLINCEDKMAEYEDPSEEPNIDVQYVALRGVSVALDRAVGLQLL